jgi:hypothetical protein
MFSLLSIFISVEKYILNRKPAFTIFTFVGLLISLISMILTVLGVGLRLPEETGFQTVAQYTLYATAPVLAIGIGFLYITLIRNSTGPIKKKAIMALSGLLTLVFGIALDGDILSALGFDPIRYILSPALCIIGTTLFFLTRMDSVVVEYYQTKRICIVHRGVIAGKVFICGTCGIFYCPACKEAIAAAENKCWNCGAVLDKGRELSEEEASAFAKAGAEAPARDPGVDGKAGLKGKKTKREGEW